MLDGRNLRTLGNFGYSAQLAIMLLFGDYIGGQIAFSNFPFAEQEAQKDDGLLLNTNRHQQCGSTHDTHQADIKTVSLNINV